MKEKKETQHKLTVQAMTRQDHDRVMPMVHDFYQSDAVAHTVEDCIMERTFDAAVSDNPRLDGFLLYAEGELAGFAYLTYLYAAESGECVMIEEVYLRDEYRGKGYGTQFFDWLKQTYPDAARFRLEVTEKNEAAERLYRKIGFVPLEYKQMIWE